MLKLMNHLINAPNVLGSVSFNVLQYATIRTVHPFQIANGKSLFHLYSPANIFRICYSCNDSFDFILNVLFYLFKKVLRRELGC